MADENAMNAEGSKGASRSRRLSILIVVALMIGEGVAVYFVANALSPAPAPASATEGEGDDSAANNDFAEIELADCRPSNKMAGRFITYHIRVLGLVRADQLTEIESMARARRARLEDAVNVVIRSADPKHLDEPELGTIKRRLEYEFDRIFGNENVIQEIVIPQLLQSRPGV